MLIIPAIIPDFSGYLNVLGIDAKYESNSSERGILVWITLGKGINFHYSSRRRINHFETIIIHYTVHMILR